MMGLLVRMTRLLESTFLTFLSHSLISIRCDWLQGLPVYHDTDNHQASSALLRVFIADACGRIQHSKFRSRFRQTLISLHNVVRFRVE
ncbi:hypothetical protein BDR04DRAFT_89262 [Suillus decipiens]|nr:hypothetical protein BDR04DRAFT_89262 [Suillus decipiens]